MSIWTHSSLDRGMNLSMIPITRDGATSLISRSKLKLLKIMLYNFRNYTNRHIRSSIINHILLNIKQLHSNSLRLHHLLSQILTIKLKYWNLWVRSIKNSLRQWPLLVFVLAAFCWTKSLLCNVAAFTGMLLYPESTLQLCSSRRFYEASRNYFGSLSAVRTTWYSFQTLISQQHPSRRLHLSV
jgi:hypothetical protein